MCIRDRFGAGAIVYFAVACVISYTFSSHRGIYGSQRVAVAKDGSEADGSDTLHGLGRGRAHWLPAVTRRRPPPRRDPDPPTA